MTQKSRGFTLVELITVVAIIGILAAVGFPAYTRYVVSTHTTEAQQVLLDLAGRQQQFQLDNRTYATTLTQLNYTVPATVSDFYTVAISSANETAYTLSATPKAGTSQASEPVLTINSLGVKSPADKW